jgi:DNA-directed RNA polymerase I subunit RPA2
MGLVLPPLEYPKKPSLDYINKGFGPTPKEPRPALQHLGRPHVESFNFMLNEGMDFALRDMKPVEFEIPQSGDRIALWIKDVEFTKPRVEPGKVAARTKEIYPTEFRQRGGSYKGSVILTVGYSVHGVERPSIKKVLGNLPVMLRSNACNLSGLSPKQLVQRGEHEEEWGGYFVIGGHERLIRILQTTRRNYPIAMKRPSWRQRGKNFSDMGVLLECGKKDLTTVKNVLHYVTTGTARFMFAYNRELFFVPVIMLLKCIKDVTDAELYKELMVGAGDDPYRRGVVVNMIRELQEEALYSRDQAREFIGRSFKEKVRGQVPSWYSNQEVTDWLIDTCVAVHVKQPQHKFSIICLMIKKLFALIQDKCVLESVDSLMMHELVLGGHLYLQLLKEKMSDLLGIMKATTLKKAKTEGGVNWD